MNIRQLSAFRAVMATRGVGRAAEVLNVTQSAVSQQIALLEAECGFPLFDRRSNRLSPTKEAEALIVEVETMFGGIQRVDRIVAALREHEWGAIRIASFPAIAHTQLPRTVARYSALHADVHFHLQSMRSRSLIDAVAARQADFALSFLPTDRSEVESVHMQTLKVVCILPAGHRLADKKVIVPEDLRDESFISLGPQDQSRVLIDRIFDDHDVSRKITIETGQSDAACTFVAEGCGVALIDPISAWSNKSSRIVIRKFQPAIEFNIWLIRPTSAASSALHDDFIDFLKADLAAAEYTLEV